MPGGGSWHPCPALLTHALNSSGLFARVELSDTAERRWLLPSAYGCESVCGSERVGVVCGQSMLAFHASEHTARTHTQHKHTTPVKRTEGAWAVRYNGAIFRGCRRQDTQVYTPRAPPPCFQLARGGVLQRGATEQSPPECDSSLSVA